MVLTKLVMNLESRAARRDLANAYQMHSTLMRLVDSGAGKPLWRLERPPREGPPIVLIQTESAPPRSALREVDEEYFVSFESRENRLLANLAAGDLLRFRVRANPTVTREKKRHGLVRYEEQIGWIERQLRRNGATPKVAEVLDSRSEVFRRRRGGAPVTIVGVTYDGSLRVDDPLLLRGAVVRGIGHGRSFGFGLITLGR